MKEVTHMNNLNDVSSLIFSEFSKTGKSVAVHAESNVLVIKVGNADTRILNWQNLPIQNILETARSLVLQENFKGQVILHG